MARRTKSKNTSKDSAATIGYEAQLWQMADALRGSVDAAEHKLRGVARELVATVRNNVTIDWTMRENVRAQLRVLVKRIPRKHAYRPDKQEEATQTMLEQAALLSAEWAIAQQLWATYRMPTKRTNREDFRLVVGTHRG